MYPWDSFILLWNSLNFLISNKLCSLYFLNLCEYTDFLRWSSNCKEHYLTFTELCLPGYHALLYGAFECYKTLYQCLMFPVDLAQMLIQVPDSTIHSGSMKPQRMLFTNKGIMGESLFLVPEKSLSVLRALRTLGWFWVGPHEEAKNAILEFLVTRSKFCSQLCC